MRRILSALAIASMFSAVPAFAATKHVARTPKSTSVARADKSTKVAEPAKTDEAKPAEGTQPEAKPTKKHTKKSKKAEEAKPAEGAPAK